VRLGLVLLLSASIGCSAPGRPFVTTQQRVVAPPVPFPSSMEIERLAAAPPPLVTADAADVPTWDLAGPFPDAPDAGAAPYPGPWGALLDAAAAGGAFTAADSMHCVARELGRFYLRHQAQPTETLRRYIDGWCGNTAPQTDVRYYRGDVPAQAKDEEVVTHWKSDVATMLEGFGSAPGARAGIWYGRDNGRAVVLVARAVPWIQLAPTTTAAPDGIVALRGTMLRPAQEIRVLVNRGALGVAACTLDEGVALPAFAARCELEPADPAAWIEVTAVPPGRVLGIASLRLLVRRPAAVPRYAVVDPLAGDTGADATAALINRMRATAGLRPLTVDETQSTLARQLAPHFFGAMFGGDSLGITERISLGLMAGWRLPDVTSAGIYAAWTMGTDPGALLAASLDSPVGRSVLLDPQASHLAVGELPGAGSSVRGSLFVTYSTLPPDAAAVRSSVLEAIQAARRARGLAPLRPISTFGSLESQLASQLRGGAVTPDEALAQALRSVVEATQRDARGGYVVGSPLDRIGLPEGALAPGAPGAVLVVAPYKPTGEPWWRWAVVLVVV
jgi:hypothetical protein